MRMKKPLDDLSHCHLSSMSLFDLGKPKRYFVNLTGWTILFVLALITGTALISLSSYRAILRQEKINLRNVSIALSAQVRTAASTVDYVLSELQREVLRTSDNAGMPANLEYLKRINLGSHYGLAVSAFDLNGNVLASTFAHDPLWAPGPDSVRGKTTNGIPDRSFQVSSTAADPDTGRSVLNFTHPLVDASGHTIGTLLAQLDSRYFQEIFASISLGESGAVTLLNRDGATLLGGPGFPREAAHAFSQTPLFQRYLRTDGHGAFEGVSAADGEDRIYGYDSVEGYPLLIVTELKKSEALSFWMARLQTTAFFVSLLCLTACFLSWRTYRDRQQQASLLGKLASSEDRLTQNTAYLKKILNSIQNPVWVLDSQHQFVLLNEAFSRLVGRRHEDLLGRHESEALNTEQSADKQPDYGTIRIDQIPRDAEINILDARGETHTMIKLVSVLPDAEGQTQTVSVLTDITARKKAEMRLAYIAAFDPLTGLANQGQFRRILEAQILQAGSENERLGVVVISLQRLQEIVELMGHTAGDDALKQASDMLGEFLPSTHCIARVNSNEFAVLVKPGGEALPLRKLVDALYGSLSSHFYILGQEFYLGPAIGIALFPEDGKGADELLRLADIAKQRASLDGKGPIHFFSEAANTHLKERLSIERHLRRALSFQEFRVFYQPKVEIGSGLIVGFEALLRWFSPILGEVPPAKFIPIAESTGLILPIGAWVMEQACQHASSWSEQFGKTVKVAVNLSLRQFSQGDLLQVIKQHGEACGLNSDSLELEITESTVMSRAHEVVALMTEIRALGITLSIDDFGTGYSSLAHLKQFPVQRLKIDRSFIQDLGRDEDSTAIVRSIIELGHGLKLRVLAEGVETAEQLDMLKEMSCDEYQGYLFSYPVPAAAVPILLRENWPLP
jgi:diguanylate cyclase (GGDEF)-like protein/PAS domain S-box-containing protein